MSKMTFPLKKHLCLPLLLFYLAIITLPCFLSPLKPGKQGASIQNLNFFNTHSQNPIQQTCMEYLLYGRHQARNQVRETKIALKLWSVLWKLTFLQDSWMQHAHREINRCKMRQTFLGKANQRNLLCLTVCIC